MSFLFIVSFFLWLIREESFSFHINQSIYIYILQETSSYLARSDRARSVNDGEVELWFHSRIVVLNAICICMLMTKLAAECHSHACLSVSFSFLSSLGSTTYVLNMYIIYKYRDICIRSILNIMYILAALSTHDSCIWCLTTPWLLSETQAGIMLHLDEKI